jgi:hypothetical protein
MTGTLITSGASTCYVPTGAGRSSHAYMSCHILTGSAHSQGSALRSKLRTLNAVGKASRESMVDVDHTVQAS